MQMLPHRRSLHRSGWVAYLNSSGHLPLPLNCSCICPNCSLFSVIFCLQGCLKSKKKKTTKKNMTVAASRWNAFGKKWDLMYCRVHRSSCSLHRFLLFVFRTHLFRLAWCRPRRRVNNILTDHFLAFTLTESKDVQVDNSHSHFLFFCSLIHSNPASRPFFFFYRLCSWKLSANGSWIPLCLSG